MKRLLSIDEAAEYIGMSKPFIYKCVSAGTMPGVVHVGRCVKIDVECIDRQIRTGQLLLDKSVLQA